MIEESYHGYDVIGDYKGREGLRSSYSFLVDKNDERQFEVVAYTWTCPLASRSSKTTMREG